MSEHRIPRELGPIPGHRSAGRAPPKFKHVSKELHMEPIMEPALDADGKKVMQVVGYRFVLHRGDGKPFKKAGPRRYLLQSNDWGAAPYVLHRQRSDAAYQVRLAQQAAAAELL